MNESYKKQLQISNIQNQINNLQNQLIQIYKNDVPNEIYKTPNVRYDIRVFGLRRSGNHHIIDCILNTFDAHQVHWYNDLPDNDINKYYDTCHYIKSDDKNVPTKSRQFLCDNNLYSIHNNKCLIQSYEDKNIQAVLHNIEKQYIKSEICFNILILRDIFNTMASRLICSQKSNLYAYTNPDLIINDVFKKMWLCYAKEFLGITNIIKNKVTINYNKIAENDVTYIQQLQHYLNTHFTKVNTIMTYGHGSSFPGYRNYNERYKLLPKEHLYVLKQLWNDPEIRSIHLKIFHFTPVFDI